MKQNVEKNQPDNTKANRIADEANTTTHETVARIRSHDQDLPNPSPESSPSPRRESEAEIRKTASRTARTRRGTRNTPPARRPRQRAQRRSTILPHRSCPSRMGRRARRPVSEGQRLLPTPGQGKGRHPLRRRAERDLPRRRRSPATAAAIRSTPRTRVATARAKLRGNARRPLPMKRPSMQTPSGSMAGARRAGPRST